MKINTADKANYSIGALIDRYIQLFVGAFWGHGVRYSLLPFSQEEYVNLQGAGKKTCHILKDVPRWLPTIIKFDQRG